MGIQKNFKVTNGLEVNADLIFADANSNKVGIATTSVSHTLDVNGTIGSKNSIITGVSTVNDLVINSRLGVGNSFGNNGQYLAATGTGVTWKTVVAPRTSTVYTAGVGDTSFAVTYQVGLVDVYINGIRLAPTEFTATDGVTVGIADSCFGGETVELVVYNSI